MSLLSPANPIFSATGCPQWTLPDPQLGKKTCKVKFTSSGQEETICSVECEKGAQFVVQPHPEYVCYNRMDWQPSRFVPDCVLDGKCIPDGMCAPDSKCVPDGMYALDSKCAQNGRCVPDVMCAPDRKCAPDGRCVPICMCDPDRKCVPDGMCAPDSKCPRW